MYNVEIPDLYPGGEYGVTVQAWQNVSGESAGSSVQEVSATTSKYTELCPLCVMSGCNSDNCPLKTISADFEQFRLCLTVHYKKQLTRIIILILKKMQLVTIL